MHRVLRYYKTAVQFFFYKIYAHMHKATPKYAKRFYFLKTLESSSLIDSKTGQKLISGDCVLPCFLHFFEFWGYTTEKPLSAFPATMSVKWPKKNFFYPIFLFSCMYFIRNILKAERTTRLSKRHIDFFPWYH